KGGVQGGDVITAIDGKPVESVQELRNQVARTAPGTKITLSIFRDGKTMELSFPLGTQPAQNPAFAEDSGKPKPAIAENNDLGVSVKTVDADAAHKRHLGAEKGVVITEVVPDSLAATLG